jgi:hypothetical protein
MKDSIMKIYIIDKNKFTNNYLKYCLYYLNKHIIKLIIFYKLPIVQ